MNRIYLDNAATSWPKPDSVYDAVDHFQRKVGVAAGRGAYGMALEVDRQLDQTRKSLADLLDAPADGQVVFAYSGTDALHLAFGGLLRPGDHVVTSVCDHNAVLRPLRDGQLRGDLTVTRVGSDGSGVIDPAEVRGALRSNTRLVALLHASNVTGVIQPIADVGRMLENHPALFLVDAAQTLGHAPLSVRELRCDLLAAPGHKGLLGPTGTGVLYLRPGLDHELRPVRTGGTGTHSQSDDPPRAAPHAYEAGNLNVPGLLGMQAGIAYVQQRGVEQIARHEDGLVRQLLEGLRVLPHVVTIGPDPDDRARVGVVSFQVADFDPQEVAVLLDQAAGIQVRAGFHCAPRMHIALGTAEAGGTVRASVGPFSTADDVAALVAVLASLAG